MRSRKYLLAAGLVLSSVVSSYFVGVSTAQQSAQPQTADNEYQVGAILFMQKSAEYRALCYQAFNWARRVLDEDEKAKKRLPRAERRMTRAVVVDIDETVLDNSPHQVYLVRNRLPFNSRTWYEWSDMRRAKAIPGAVEFLKYAHSRGVRVFYVSNRDEVQKAATIDNLKAVGFPDATEETVLLRTTESTKEPRRRLISQKYRIVTLIGDNLNDLSDVFERKSIDDRFAEVENAKHLWGNKFIVLPNAMYGDWENAIYQYQRLSESEKAAKRLNAMEGY